VVFSKKKFNNPHMKIKIERINDDSHMRAENETGNTLEMDGSPDAEGNYAGFRPMQMLLAAAGGCSAIDVISILKKQKQDLETLKVEVDGNRVQKSTYSEFDKINLHFILSGNLEESKVEKAISLSVNKYCSVSKALQPQAEITYSYEVKTFG